MNKRDRLTSQIRTLEQGIRNAGRALADSPPDHEHRRALRERKTRWERKLRRLRAKLEQL